MIVNFDHVYIVSPMDHKRESAGCTLSFLDPDRYRLQVIESRTEILKLLSAPPK